MVDDTKGNPFAVTADGQRRVEGVRMVMEGGQYGERIQSAVRSVGVDSVAL